MGRDCLKDTIRCGQGPSPVSMPVRCPGSQDQVNLSHCQCASMVTRTRRRAKTCLNLPRPTRIRCYNRPGFACHLFPADEQAFHRRLPRHSSRYRSSTVIGSEREGSSRRQGSGSNLSHKGLDRNFDLKQAPFCDCFDLPGRKVFVKGCFLMRRLVESAWASWEMKRSYGFSVAPVELKRCAHFAHRQRRLQWHAASIFVPSGDTCAQ